MEKKNITPIKVQPEDIISLRFLTQVIASMASSLLWDQNKCYSISQRIEMPNADFMGVSSVVADCSRQFTLDNTVDINVYREFVDNTSRSTTHYDIGHVEMWTTPYDEVRIDLKRCRIAPLFFTEECRYLLRSMMEKMANMYEGRTGQHFGVFFDPTSCEIELNTRTRNSSARRALMRSVGAQWNKMYVKLLSAEGGATSSLVLKSWIKAPQDLGEASVPMNFSIYATETIQDLIDEVDCMREASLASSFNSESKEAVNG